MYIVLLDICAVKFWRDSKIFCFLSNLADSLFWRAVCFFRKGDWIFVDLFPHLIRVLVSWPRGNEKSFFFRRADNSREKFDCSGAREI